MISLQLFIKRSFDIIAGIILLLILVVIPVMIVVPIAIKLTSKGPAVFTQDRVGKNGRIFKIYKFRTMYVPEDRMMADGSTLDPAHSITPVGKFLRKTSLDELAQLFNIINGTMSFVGPRPTLPYQVEKYTERQKHRHDMRPGVTGWAQVNGRNNLTWTQKIDYDLYYIEHFSIWLDIKIFLKTVLVVFKHEGIEFTQADSLSSESNVSVQISVSVDSSKK